MADPHDLLARADAEEAAEVAALEGRASPFSALYAHWERNQWSALALDLETDRRSFEALDASAQAGMVWIFAHRFHAEFSVARLLAPFLLAAPSYDVQLLLATQVADEHRHLQAVLRIYEEVFGVRGGIEAVRAVADRNMDLVAEALYERLEHHVGQALGDLGRGRVPRSGRRLPPARGGRDRPHRAEPRRDPVRAALVPGAGRGPAPRRPRRGTSHRDRRLVRAPAHGAGAGAHERGDHELIEELLGLWAELLGPADAELGDLVRSGYGIEPIDFYWEALRLVRVRLASVGYDAASRD